MVPPWVPNIPLPPTSSEEETPDDPQDAEDAESLAQRPDITYAVMAPPSRFGSARRNLGDYMQHGEHAKMRRGLGQYIKKGYGGSAAATRRFAGTAQTANALSLALSGGSGNPYATPGSPLDPTLIAGCSADEVMDAVVEAIRPVDGTQDAEASRAAIKDALSDVLATFPDADLCNLEDAHRDLAIERYVAGDVFRRVELDLGKAMRAKAPTAAAGLGRLKEVRDYIRETVAASFRQLRSAGQRPSANQITQIVQRAIRDTFQVFEGYAQ